MLQTGQDRNKLFTTLVSTPWAVIHLSKIQFRITQLKQILQTPASLNKFLVVGSCLQTLPPVMSPQEALHRLLHPSSSLRLSTLGSLSLSLLLSVTILGGSSHTWVFLPSGWSCQSLCLLTSNELILSTDTFASHFTEQKEAIRQGFPSLSTMETFQCPHQLPNTASRLILLCMKHPHFHPSPTP